MAHCYGANSLKEICMDYIVLKSEEVKQTSAFQELVNEPSLLMELVMRLK